MKVKNIRLELSDEKFVQICENCMTIFVRKKSEEPKLSCYGSCPNPDVIFGEVEERRNEWKTLKFCEDAKNVATENEKV